jgi:hypothetical protein
MAHPLCTTKESKLRQRKTIICIAVLAGCFVVLWQWSALSPFGNRKVAAAAAQDTNSDVRQKGRGRGCPRCATPGDYEIYAPLLALAEAQSSEVVFNSRSPQTTSVTPIFYKRDGTRIVGAAVDIESAEIRYVGVRKLLPPQYRDDRDWGGISLAYHGVPREIWAQLRFLGVNGGGNVDEFFVVKAENRSDVQEAVWWTPAKSTSIIALGNVSNVPSGAKLKFGDGAEQTVQLAPNGTEIVRHENSKSVESVQVEITGLPGSIIPTGVITSRDGSFNSVIRFYDTKNARQPHLFANGLRLAGVTPHLVLKNTSATSVTAQPAVISSEGVTAREPLLLPAVSLAGKETREVDLTAAGNKPGFEVVSLKVTNSGAPGSLIGSIHSIEEPNGLSYDTPLRDTGPVRAMTGSYPWKITNDFTTMVYVTNVSDQEADLMGEINYHGGKIVIDPRKLQPGATASFDLRRIHDTQIKDSEGRPVPRTATFGQFKWSVRGVTNGKHLLIGRAEMVSRTQRISTSYSCNDPCPPYYEGSIDPYPAPVVFVNATGNATVKETAYYDSGYHSGPYTVYGDWTISAIASVNPTFADTTTMTGESPGAGWIFSFIGMQQDYGWDGLNCYEYGTYEENASAPAAVKPTITGPNTMWWFNGATPSSYSSQTQITLSTEDTGNSYSWSVVTGGSKVTLSNQNTANVTLTSSGASGSMNDVGIEVVVDGQVSDQFNLTVRAPHQLNHTSTSHSADGTWGYRTEITYNIRDQFNTSLPGQAIPVNEDFTTGVISDFSGMDWRQANEAGATLPLPNVSDVITGEISTHFPTPQSPQSPLGSTKVCHWGQDIYVGSATIGSGRRVQSNTHQKYRDHAAHENITSPNP